MLRVETLKLYRNFLRLIYELPDKKQQKDLRDWVRSDFETNKHHTDEVSELLLLYSIN